MGRHPAGIETVALAWAVSCWRERLAARPGSVESRHPAPISTKTGGLVSRRSAKRGSWQSSSV